MLLLCFGFSPQSSNRYNGELRPIRYASRAFNPVESRWDTVHQELFPIKEALDKSCPYVLACSIKVVTDIKENSHQLGIPLMLLILLSLIGTLLIRNCLPSHRLLMTSVDMFWLVASK